jgi:hypothetical protein
VDIPYPTVLPQILKSVPTYAPIPNTKSPLGTTGADAELLSFEKRGISEHHEKRGIIEFVGKNKFALLGGAALVGGGLWWWDRCRRARAVREEKQKNMAWLVATLQAADKGGYKGVTANPPATGDEEATRVKKIEKRSRSEDLDKINCLAGEKVSFDILSS